MNGVPNFIASLRLKFFRNRSIKTKLIWIILAAELIVILLGLSGLVIRDLYSLRQEVIGHSRIVANVFSQDFLKILVLGSQDLASDTLSQLDHFPYVRSALLYNKNSHLILSYDKDRQHHLQISPPEVESIKFDKKYLHASYSIDHNEQTYGSIYLRISHTHLVDKIFLYLKTLILSILPLILLSVLIALYFQGLFTLPIMRLTTVIREVTSSHDYSVSVETSETSEIGELYRGFNQMLQTIEQSQQIVNRTQAELQLANTELRHVNTELDRRRQSAERLAEIGRLMSQSLDQKEVGQCIADHSVVLLNAQASTLYVTLDGSHDLSTFACSGTPPNMSALPVGTTHEARLKELVLQERHIVASPPLPSDLGLGTLATENA